MPMSYINIISQKKISGGEGLPHPLISHNPILLHPDIRGFHRLSMSYCASAWIITLSSFKCIAWVAGFDAIDLKELIKNKGCDYGYSYRDSIDRLLGWPLDFLTVRNNFPHNEVGDLNDITFYAHYIIWHNFPKGIQHNLIGG